MKKKILIIAGDPNSINSEIIFKSWKKINKDIKKKIYLIANRELLIKQLKQLKYSLKIKTIKNLSQNSKADELKLINIDLKFNNPFKVNKELASQYVKKCLNLGHNLSVNKDVLGLINCPINKYLLKKKNIGVTEFLANKCKLRDSSEVMMIKNKNFAVCPITTHLDLKNVSKNINKKKIISKVKTIGKYFRILFKRKPKIGILGLNPHNAELRSGSEENNEIIPAIKNLKKKGFNIDGPLVSDTVFIKDFRNYDVIVGMYHDQVLSPFKSIFKYDGINLTLGLKYLRVSPDHGVAMNIIKKNKANASSLLECIKFINKFG
tara:strand:+ start:6864 stop:7826 length:963 start_codon:yes stop_codon:yes gene_type:complete